MLEPKHLNNAPIVEAVIELVVTPPPGFQVQRFLSLKQRVVKDYPHSNELKTLVGTIDLKPDGILGAASSPPVVSGYQYWSSDKLFVAQVRPDLFLFSRLKPYTSWEHFSAEARRFWQEFKAVAAPLSTIKKTGLRFINRLEVPLPAKTTDYLNCPPKAPDELNGQITGFLSHIQIHEPESGVGTTIVQFLEPLTKPGVASLILDINAFKYEDLEVEDNKIWKNLEMLRGAKNRAFFTSITEKSYRMFE